ncbi:MAG: hypothetical protein V1758_09995 [Pseudomonadota bacterium]
MKIEDLYRFAYTKTPLDKVFDRLSAVPEEYLMDWLKDMYDYQRSFSDEDLRANLSLEVEHILDWLEEEAEFV